VSLRDTGVFSRIVAISSIEGNIFFDETKHLVESKYLEEERSRAQNKS
jgi:hypothetical protein